MKSLKSVSYFLATASLLTAVASVHAQGLTREQVRAELAEAIRNGDMIVNGDLGRTERELYPHRYPARSAGVAKTREQVREELAEAQRIGDVVRNGDSGLKEYELNPHRYPARPVAVGKTRQQVREELELALRLGDAPLGDKDGLSPAQRTPERFAEVRAQHEMAMKASRGVEMSQSANGAVLR